MAASYRPPPASALDLDLTVVSAKHLKNVNWRNGDLKPYAVFWVDPDRRLSTRSDDSGSTRPVWNERFTVPLTAPLQDTVLTLEIFHSKPSETPKPLVGTLRIELKELSDLDDRLKIRTFCLLRPSGRPQGKIRVKLGIRERPLPPPPDYHYAPASYYYSNTPPPHPPRYSASSYVSLPQTLPYSSIPDAYPPPYSSHCYPTPPPPMPPRPFLERSYSYGGPSAPLDYSPYDHKPRGVGAATASLGGRTLEDGMRYEEGKIGQRVEHDVSSRERDDYSDYRHPDY